jgi:hypothetical protein
MVIALKADMSFWVAGEIGGSYSFHRAMFGLFSDTDIDIAEGSTIRVSPGEEADPRVCSGSNDAGELLFFQPFLCECRRRK